MTNADELLDNIVGDFSDALLDYLRNHAKVRAAVAEASFEFMTKENITAEDLGYEEDDDA